MSQLQATFRVEYVVQEDASLLVDASTPLKPVGRGAVNAGVWSFRGKGYKFHSVCYIT